MHEQQNKAIGSGVLAGAFWGTPFLAPLILTQFSSIEIAFGRFLFFGIVSLIALPRLMRLTRQFSWVDLLQAIAISAAGFWLYTIVLFTGVKLTNGVVGSLIIGMLPLTITAFSKPKFNHKFVSGMVLILAGIVFLLIVPLIFSDSSKSTLKHIHLTGVILLFLALAIWTWYAIYNARFILKHPRMSAVDYSSLMGILSLICMLPIFLFANDFKHIIESIQLPAFILWTAILGIGASWIANFFWAYCCRNCPPSIYGTLIVSETIFGLIYSFAFQRRFPYFNEYIAIILLVFGVIVTIKSQIEPKRKEVP